jgi:hypothetical protein
MPTKQELETINDDLLSQNEQLQRESAERIEQLTELTATLQAIAARLENLAAAAPQPQSASNSSNRDEFAAQIEPLVTGLKKMIEAAHTSAAEQQRQTQIIRAQNEQAVETTRKFKTLIAHASQETYQLGRSMTAASEQPKVTLLKIAGAMFASMILAGVLIVFYASWTLSPSRRALEDATKWQVLTEEMPPEKVKQIEQQIENKLYKREQNGQIGAQTSGANSQPAASAPAPAQMSQPAPSTNRRSRR